MTCIVGLVQNGIVIIGGDSAASNKKTITVRDSPKVFEREGYIFAFTSSFRMGDILEMRIATPKVRKPAVSLRRHLITTWVDDELRRVFKMLGYSKKENNAESGGSFLVGHLGELCVIRSNFQVGTPREGYCAVGSGATLALGALYAMSKDTRLSGKTRVIRALEAAEYHSPFVRHPFTILQS